MMKIRENALDKSRENFFWEMLSQVATNLENTENLENVGNLKNCQDLREILTFVGKLGKLRGNEKYVI